MIEIIKNERRGTGFDVLYTYDGWKLAFISYAEQYGDLTQLKRHIKTDEAFLLIRGTATLFSSVDGEKIEKLALKREQLYVVKQKTWHHLSISKNALILVAENSDTSKENTEARVLSEKEINEVNK